METWYDYRTVWARHFWVLGIAVLAVVMIVVAVVGTATRSNAAILFVPGLAILFIHHLVVRKALED